MRHPPCFPQLVRIARRTAAFFLRSPLSRRRQSGGFATVVVVVAIVVISVVLASIMQMTRNAQATFTMLGTIAQADALTISGRERARLKLERDADYGGEVWSITRRELIGDQEANFSARGTSVGAGDPKGEVVGSPSDEIVAQVTISVIQAGEDREPRIKVVADYPIGKMRCVRRQLNSPLEGNR